MLIVVKIRSHEVPVASDIEKKQSRSKGLSKPTQYTYVTCCLHYIPLGTWTTFSSDLIHLYEPQLVGNRWLGLKSEKVMKEKEN